VPAILHIGAIISEKVCNPVSYLESSGAVNGTGINHWSRRPILVLAAALLLVNFSAFTCRVEAQDALPAVVERVEPQVLVAENSASIPSETFEAPLPVPADPPANDTVVDVSQVDSGIPRRFHYQFRLNVHSVYDDNINISQGQSESDFYTAIEPSIMLGFGDFTSREGNFIRLNYLASVFLFADHSENDALQHVFQLEGQYQLNRLTLNLTQSIQILDGTDVRSLDSAGNFGQQVNLDVAGRARFNIYTTRVNAAYYLTGKTFLSVGGDYTDSDYHSLISSDTISGNLFLNYNYGPKLVIGFGGTAGWNRVDAPTPDQTFEQANVRVSYQVTGKIDVRASAGVEFRNFEGQGRDQYVSPVFDFGLNYLPFDGTTFSLTANRHLLNSAVLAGQDFATTSFTVSASQRLVDRISVAGSVGYENSDYFSAIAGGVSNRRDNYFFVEPSIAVRVTRFWTVGAYYLHRANDSSFNAFSFHDNQVGVRTSLTF
jgi:Putative beta-barrel porin 2